MKSVFWISIFLLVLSAHARAESCDYDLLRFDRWILSELQNGATPDRITGMIRRLRSDEARAKRVAEEFFHSKQEYLSETGGLVQQTMLQLKRFDELNGVRYITADELSKLKLELRDGLFYQGGQLLDSYGTSTRFRSGQNLMMFVMDTQGNLYASREGDFGFQHSSFFAGGPIAAVGEMRVKNGRLELLTDQSGHYRPTLDITLQGVRRLVELGLDLSQVEIRLLGVF